MSVTQIKEKATNIVDVDWIMTWENSPSVLTVEQMAQLLQIGINKAYQLVSMQEFPSIKMGKIHRIPLEPLREYLNKKAEEHSEL